jgi:hypothetical protein
MKRRVAAAFIVAGAIAATAGCARQPMQPGELLVRANCGQADCHTLDRVMTARKTRTQWSDAIARMRSHGLDVTDAQARTIVDYLSARDASQ